MERERLDKWCEWGILGLVLAILIYGPLATGAVRPRDFQIIEWLTLGVLALWLARIWISEEPRLFWPPVCWAVLAFVGYAIYRYSGAEIEYVARQEVIKVFTYALLFFAVINNLNRQEYSSIIVGTVVTLAAAISLYALYQFLTNSNHVWHIIRPEQYARRGSGTYINPNHLAGFLEMILPVGLAYTLMGRVKTLTRILLGYATLLIFIGIGATISRGGWIATALTLIAFSSVLGRQKSYRVYVFALATLLAIAALVFASTTGFTRQRVQSLADWSRPGSRDLRADLWPPTVKMWRDYFWLGMGPAHYNYRFPEYRPESLQIAPDRAHNDYLNTLVDWGLVGALLVAITFAIFFGCTVKTWRVLHRSENELQQRRSNRSALVLGTACGVLAILIHSATDFNMHIPANAVLMVGLLALGTAHYRFATQRGWISHPLLVRMLVTLMTVAGLCYLGLQTFRRGKAISLQHQIAQEKTFSVVRLEKLKVLYELEPMDWTTPWELGEYYLGFSLSGDNDYVAQAKEAMRWYTLGIKVNPYDQNTWLHHGMCLDWINDHAQADKYFEKAGQLDPNGAYTAALLGWHHVQKGDFAGAKPLLERSLKLKWQDNRMASTYLEIVNRRLEEQKNGLDKK